MRALYFPSILAQSLPDSCFQKAAADNRYDRDKNNLNVAAFSLHTEQSAGLWLKRNFRRDKERKIQRQTEKTLKLDFF